MQKSNDGEKARVAYFCTEFGREGLPFGGGLGILAGDYTKSAADLGLPVVGIGLLYSQGNFHQKLSEDGWQTEWYEKFDPTGIMTYHSKDVTVPIEGRDVKLNAWKFSVVGETGHVVPIFFLDTEGNNHDRPWDDNICNILYPSKHPYERITQEQVLGTGGVRTLDALGYKNIEIYHLNEGHAALAGLELLKKYGSVEETKKRMVFTTHTPVPAGMEQFTRELAEQVLGNDLPSKDYMRSLTGAENLNMARLAMALSSESFGVSSLHAQVSKYLFNDFPNMDKLYRIDNGIHLQTWTAPPVQKLYDILTYGEWRLRPKSLEKILELSPEQVLNVHKISREKLGEFLNNDPKVKGSAYYNPAKLTIGFARRFATYKQATLLFEQFERLRNLGDDIQIVFSGKAHPGDNSGKEVIKEVFRYMSELKGQVSIWFIEDYDMRTAKYMVRGVDLWLNNPEKLKEASGTSGMKAAANFIPQLSIPDGWSVFQEPAEGYSLPKGLIEGVTGWSIGEEPTEADFPILLGDNQYIQRQRRENMNSDAERLYDKLEEIIIPLFKENKTGWSDVMKWAAAHNAPWFNSHRMVEQYFERAYNLPLEHLITV